MHSFASFIFTILAIFFIILNLEWLTQLPAPNKEKLFREDGMNHTYLFSNPITHQLNYYRMWLFMESITYSESMLFFLCNSIFEMLILCYLWRNFFKII